MTTRKLVALLHLALLRNVNAHEFVHARRKLIAGIAAETQHADDASTFVIDFKVWVCFGDAVTNTGGCLKQGILQDVEILVAEREPLSRHDTPHHFGEFDERRRICFARDVCEIVSRSFFGDGDGLVAVLNGKCRTVAEIVFGVFSVIAPLEDHGGKMEDIPDIDVVGAIESREEHERVIGLVVTWDNRSINEGFEGSLMLHAKINKGHFVIGRNA